MNQLLSYREFFCSLKENLEEQLPDGFSVHTDRRTRNNGRELDSLEIVEEGENYGRVFYGEDFYEQYLRGMPPEEIAGHVVRMCMISRLPDEARDLFHYDRVKDRLAIGLINYEKNKELLNDCVCRRFLDLAMICRVMLPSGDGHMHAARVSKGLMEEWGVSEEELFRQAKKSMLKSDPPVLRPLRNILSEVSGEEFPPFSDAGELYVLTTHTGVAGASALLLSGHTGKLAKELDRDILVLPSSIHEVLLLPDWGSWQVEALRKIVSDVNHTVVSREDFLSDNVYRYCLKKEKLVIDR